MTDRPFDRFAGRAALAAAGVAVLYAVSVVILGRAAEDVADVTDALLLMLFGLLALPVALALGRRLAPAEPDFARLAMVLLIAGALGAAVHGGYDLANEVSPPDANPVDDLPSQVDPRGLLTFGATGLGLLTLSWLVARGDVLPRRLGRLAAIAAGLLLWIYVLRLAGLGTKNPLLLVPVTVSGFVVNPLLYARLGRALADNHGHGAAGEAHDRRGGGDGLARRGGGRGGRPVPARGA